MEENFFTIWASVDETGQGEDPPIEGALIQVGGGYITQVDNSLILILE